MKPPDLSGSGVAANSASSANRRNRTQNTTGRQTLVFRKGATSEGINFLRAAGFKVFVTNASDPTMLREDQVGDSDAIVYSTLGVATVGGNPEQMRQLENAASDLNNPIQRIEPEKVRRMIEYQTRPSRGQVAPSVVKLTLDYLEGCRDTYTNLIEMAESNGKATSSASSAGAAADFNESELTWGLQATKVDTSPFSGRGIKVAVLDTGIDFTFDSAGNVQYHPDFAGRKIVTASFVPWVTSAKDGEGHGTHCIGTACGPRKPSTLPGYGIASDAEIYAGKVLNDAGLGADGWIIAGIEWAINQGCRVISMSLGAPRNPGETFDQEYEEIAQRALEAGVMIIAAAGNDSSRPDQIEPVSGPADCPSIMAVAAIDQTMQIARFSNAGINLSSGGEVNVAAPGVNVHSSHLGGHRRLEGTSMATPHVAGIAALFAEANPSAGGQQLRDLVISSARTLSFGTQDVGSGLVQAPQNAQPNSAKPRRRGGAEADKSPVNDGGFAEITQTSPITIGGGGSVGLDFDATHYSEIAGGIFASPEDKLTTCQVLHQNGKLLRNFFPEIDGNQCLITVTCRDTDASTTEIRVAGGPGGQLAVAFNQVHFPLGTAGQPIRFSASRKVVSVAVTKVLTSETATFNLPDDWAGNILIDN